MDREIDGRATSRTRPAVKLNNASVTTATSWPFRPTPTELQTTDNHRNL